MGTYRTLGVPSVTGIGLIDRICRMGLARESWRVPVAFLESERMASTVPATREKELPADMGEWRREIGFIALRG